MLRHNACVLMISVSFLISNGEKNFINHEQIVVFIYFLSGSRTVMTPPGFIFRNETAIRYLFNLLFIAELCSCVLLTFTC